MKILIIRVGRLGDMVMILPALNALKAQYPHAEFHAITSKDGLRLLKIAGLHEQNILLYKKGFFSRFINKIKVNRFIKQGKFDQIYCFELKASFHFRLPKHSTILKHQNALEHYSLRCLRLVSLKSDALDYNKGYLQVPARKKGGFDSYLSAIGIKKNTLLIGFHPTYSGFGHWVRKKEHIHRMWPWQSFAELALKLAKYGNEKKLDIKIVMDLLPSERALGSKIRKASQNSVILLPTEPNFNRYLCLLNQLHVLIVSNTGVMHLAAALGTPVVALFSASQPADCGPFMPKDKSAVLRAEDSCSSHLGLASISVERVFAETIKLLFIGPVSQPLGH